MNQLFNEYEIPVDRAHYMMGRVADMLLGAMLTCLLVLGGYVVSLLV
jgi:hypothetical protein